MTTRHPRQDDQVPPAVEAEPVAVTRRSFWTSEALVALIVPLCGGLILLGAHAVIVADHVGQLERARDEFTAKHVAYEQRMTSIEATVASDRAASDKREALIEAELRDISERLSALQVSIDHLHHP